MVVVVDGGAAEDGIVVVVELVVNPGVVVVVVDAAAVLLVTVDCGVSAEVDSSSLLSDIATLSRSLSELLLKMDRRVVVLVVDGSVLLAVVEL